MHRTAIVLASVFAPCVCAIADANPSDTVMFGLQSALGSDSVTSAPIFQGTGIGYELQVTELLLTATDEFGTHRTFDMVSDLGLLQNAELPDHSFFVLGYDLSDPGDFPIPTLIHDSFQLGTVAEFELSLDFLLDFGESSAPAELTLEVLSLGIFMHDDTAYSATSIIANGELYLLAAVPTPSTTVAMLCAACLCCRRRR